MHQFFVDKNQIMGDEIVLDKESSHHLLNVLRVGANELVSALPGDGTLYLCKLKAADKKAAVLEIVEKKQEDTEAKTKVWLFQGMPKGSKFEFIIQKAVELGVYKIVPVMTKNCVVKLTDEKDKQKKLERFQKIAEEAAKQAKRGIIPKVCPPVDLKGAAKMLKDIPNALVAYECEDKKSFSDIKFKSGEETAVFIGPEGGFDETEIEMLSDFLVPISLGKRILRTETAAVTALSIIMYELGELK